MSVGWRTWAVAGIPGHQVNRQRTSWPVRQIGPTAVKSAGGGRIPDRTGEARELIHAATWLGFHGYTWQQADSGIWPAYCQDLLGRAPLDTRAVYAADRQAWIRWVIAENS